MRTGTGIHQFIIWMVFLVPVLIAGTVTGAVTVFQQMYVLSLFDNTTISTGTRLHCDGTGTINGTGTKHTGICTSVSARVTVLGRNRYYCRCLRIDELSTDARNAYR